MIRLMIVAGLLATAGCAGPARLDAGDIEPAEAVRLAAAAVPGGVPGRFVLTVRSTGAQDGNVYLDSELDYRDQRTLVVEVRPLAQQQLGYRLDRPIGSALVGHTIRVYGEARRVRIDFTAAGRPTGKYYYQTHVAVDRAEQLQLLD